MKVVNYIKNIFVGIWHLGQGMYVTMLNFCRPKVTQQYPENRGRREYGERFRALLTMPHDAENHHKCIACGICEMNCPNGTIKVTSELVTDEAGKKKKVLVKYRYDLGRCMFCQLCTRACPHGAITFDQSFENAVFDRSKLVKVLNHPGSHVEEKKIVKKPVAPAAAAASPAAAPAADPQGHCLHLLRRPVGGPAQPDQAL